jgi:hypothetical protein
VYKLIHQRILDIRNYALDKSRSSSMYGLGNDLSEM